MTRAVLVFLLGGLVFGAVVGILLVAIGLAATSDLSTVQPAFSFLLFATLCGGAGALAGAGGLVAWVALERSVQLRWIGLLVCGLVFGVVGAVGTLVIFRGAPSVALAAFAICVPFGGLAAYWSRPRWGGGNNEMDVAFDREAVLELGRRATAGFSVASFEVEQFVPPDGHYMAIQLRPTGSTAEPIWLYVNYDTSVHIQRADGRIVRDDEPLMSTTLDGKVAELEGLLRAAVAHAGWDAQTSPS